MADWKVRGTERQADLESWKRCYHEVSMTFATTHEHLSPLPYYCAVSNYPLYSATFQNRLLAPCRIYTCPRRFSECLRHLLPQGILIIPFPSATNILLCIFVGIQLSLVKTESQWELNSGDEFPILFPLCTNFSSRQHLSGRILLRLLHVTLL